MKADVTVTAANIVPQSTDVIIKYNIISYWLSTFPFRVYSTSAPSSSFTYTRRNTIISPTQSSHESTIQYLITANGILYCIVCAPRFSFDNVYFYNYRWKLGYSFTLNNILYYILLLFFFSTHIFLLHNRTETHAHLRRNRILLYYCCRSVVNPVLPTLPGDEWKEWLTSAFCCWERRWRR